jgi:6-phosphogluconolactonase (cycloisomerase 2 family)
LQTIAAYSTHGILVSNPTFQPGPNESDNEIIISGDHKFLLVANSGTNNITVFWINSDHSLSPVGGSPFPSGGYTPVSVYEKNNLVFTVNKSDAPPLNLPINPNYTTLGLDSNGSLSIVAYSKVETAKGSSPTMALVSHNKSLLFGTDLLAYKATPPQGTLRSFTFNSFGMPTPAPGTPQVIPDGGLGAIPGALSAWGLCEHPLYNNLYVGFPVQGAIGVYDIDGATGALTFKTAVKTGAGACNMRANSAGNRLYVLNSSSNSVSVVDITNPVSPVVLSTLALKFNGGGYEANGAIYSNSQCVSLGLSSNEKFLYVLSRHSTATAPDTKIDGNSNNTDNWLHVLQVQNDGSVTEPDAPQSIQTSWLVPPRGIAVLRIN